MHTTHASDDGAHRPLTDFEAAAVLDTAWRLAQQRLGEQGVIVGP